jgi:hypothetical protein
MCTAPVAYKMLCSIKAYYQLNPTPSFTSGSSLARPTLNSKKSLVPCFRSVSIPPIALKGEKQGQTYTLHKLTGRRLSHLGVGSIQNKHFVESESLSAIRVAGVCAVSLVGRSCGRLVGATTFSYQAGFSSFLDSIHSVAALYLGSRGFLIGIILMYFFAMKNIFQQLSEIAKNRKRNYTLCVHIFR